LTITLANLNRFL